MKREIKFRAWVNGKMITPPLVTVGSGSSSEIIEIALDGSLSLRNAFGLDWVGAKNPMFDTPEEDILLMQYTGLHDKNGKEIYEGDILKLQYPLNYGFGGIHKKEIIVTISFEGAAFWFTGGGYTDCNWHFYNAEDREVIGNIYEHPELLKEKITA